MMEQATATTRKFETPRWWNGPVSWVLRSPVHWLLSGRLMLITVRGRRTGRFYTLPVGYVAAPRVLYVLVGDYELKSWWRNLEEAAPVALILRGHVVDARAQVLDPGRDRDELDRALALYRARFRGILARVGSVLMVRCAVA
jgi:deazaflavin-dependent oxidoreductase (nitroreductase family)